MINITCYRFWGLRNFYRQHPGNFYAQYKPRNCPHFGVDFGIPFWGMTRSSACARFSYAPETESRNLQLWNEPKHGIFYQKLVISDKIEISGFSLAGRHFGRSPKLRTSQCWEHWLVFLYFFSSQTSCDDVWECVRKLRPSLNFFENFHRQHLRNFYQQQIKVL